MALSYKSYKTAIYKTLRQAASDDILYGLVFIYQQLHNELM